jgi:tRNA(Ile)-lysidine synthetase-like protein
MHDAFPSNRLTSALERRVREALDAHVPRHEAVVVACSGGPDSTATLIAIARTRRGSRARDVIVATFDHGIRAEAETSADRVAVETLARELGVRCVHGEVRDLTADASEAAAREARYRWLADACRSANARYCVTGHTRDDQAETVLMRLTRGTGLGGVVGMAASADWPVSHDHAGELRLVRPLLEVRRLEVLSYLEALGVEPRFDATNELVTFDRNRLRHRVLPELRAINPRVDAALTHFAAVARRDDEALEAWAQREAAAIVDETADEVRVARAALRALPEAVASRVLRRAARSLGLSLDGVQVEMLWRLLRRRGSRLSLAGGHVLVEDEAVVFRRNEVAGDD